MNRGILPALGSALLFGASTPFAKLLVGEVLGARPTSKAATTRIYMGHLRHKLEVDPTQPRYFITETGVGYRSVP